MWNKLLIIGLLCVSLGLGQRKGGGGGGDMGEGNLMPAGTPTRLDTIATIFNLNKDQKKAVKTILEEGAKEAAPLRDQISKSRIAVGDAVAGKKGDDDIKQSVKASGELSARLTQLEVKTFARIFASLDETQKTDRQSISRVFGMMNGIYHTKSWNEQ